MQVVLINPPDINSLDPKLDPPLGLMYLSSTLKENSIDCKILDFAFFDKSKWNQLIKDNPADLYGLTVYTPSVYTSDIINKLIKSNHPNSKIVWGGSHPTFEWVNSFLHYPELDYVILGEGEETLLDLCNKFNSQQPDVLSLATKIDKLFSINNLRPLIKNLDKLPLPDRSIGLNKYTRKVDGNLSTPIMTGRGCAYSCKFCCSRYFWKYPRFHSTNRIKTELDEIKSMGFDAFHVWDDTFTLNIRNVEEILRYVKYLGLNFRCNGDLRRDTKKLLQQLYDSGCREYAIGIESGDQRVLDLIGKGTTVERNKQVIKWAKEIGLPIKAYIMVGNPGEDWKSIDKTLDFMKKVEPDYYTLSSFTPLPGCTFHTEQEKYKIKIRTKNLNEFFNIGRQNEGGSTHDTEFMTAEDIKEARKYLVSNLPKQVGKLQDYYKNVK